MRMMKSDAELKTLISGKKVLFLATKNSEYIRISQEIELLEKYSSSVEKICFSDKSYGKRLLKVIGRLLFLNTKKFDLIYVSFMPQMLVPFFCWKWHGKVLVTDFFISIYDTLVYDRKKVQAQSVLGKMLHWIDRLTISKSDYLVADTKAHGTYFAEEFGFSKDNIFTMYLNADRSVYYPRMQSKSVEFQDKFHVLYFGSILPLQGVEYVLQAANILKNKKNIQFTVIGPIRNKIEKPVLETVSYIEWLSQKELADAISQADLCLAGHFSADIKKAERTIPGKAYIYEAMEKPMILGDTLANHELFSSDENHSFVKTGDPQALADEISRKYYEWLGNKKV